MTKKTNMIAESGIIAAIYVVLTLISTAFGISSGAIQVRLSEALCILPCFTTAAIPGLTVGCLLSNILSGCVIWDIVFGTLATLIGAIGTHLLKSHRFLASVPPIISNIIIIPLILAKAYHIETAFFLLMLSVGTGEVISCGIFGQLLYTAVSKYGLFQNR